MKTRNDKLAIGLIWLLVVAGALLVAANSSDPGGVGEVAAGIGIAFTAAYWYLRRLRTSATFIPVDKANVGTSTTNWLTAVLFIVLWLVGSVILILARVPDGYAMLLGWLLPITVYVIYRFRARRTG